MQIRLLAVAVCTLVLTGCVERDALYNEIYANRATAFDSWKRAKDGKETEAIVLQGQLDLPSAIVIAVGNNKQLKAALTEKESAAGKLIEAYSAALPKLNFDTTLHRTDPIGNKYPNPYALHNYDLSLILRQPIFHGGAILAGIRAAQIGIYATDESIATTIETVIYDTRRDYYAALLAKELMKVSEGDLNVSRAHLSDVQKKRSAGVSSEYDVIRAKVDVTNVEAQYIQRENAWHLASTTLLRTMGVSQESDIEFSTALKYEPIQVTIEESVKTAYSKRPEILQAEMNIRINREAVRQAWAGLLPTIDVNGSRQWAKPLPYNSNIDKWGDAWNYGAVMSWPIFDGFATWGNVRQARAALQKSVIQLADTEEQVLLDVKQAMLSIDDADRFVKSQTDNIEQAKEGLRLVKAGYDAGVNTELEMLDARQALSQSQALYYQAVFQHEKAKLDMEKATGILRAKRAEQPEE